MFYFSFKIVKHILLQQNIVLKYEIDVKIKENYPNIYPIIIEQNAIFYLY